MEMNASRRKEINKLYARLTALNETHSETLKLIATELEEIRDKLDTIKSEEEDSFNNMPESLQDGEKGQASQDATGYMDEAYSELDTLVDALASIDLETTLEHLDNASA